MRAYHRAEGYEFLTNFDGKIPIDIIKVKFDAEGSGLFLVIAKMAIDREDYPRGTRLCFSGRDVIVGDKTIHKWAMEFNQPDKAKFEQDFMQWLWSQIGKPIVVECIEEPRGYRGLEGYQKGDRYMAVMGRDHCKVYPVVGDAYCELCTLPVFKRFFKEI